MSRTGLIYDVAFNDQPSWGAFVLAHFMRHKTLRSIINSKIATAKIDNITADHLDWMLPHAEEHLAIAAALGVNPYPNLAEADLTDQGQFSNWMYYHRLEHKLFDQATGLF